MSETVSIAVVGSGYVGLVAAACFAEIGHRVVCVDNDEAKVRKLQDGGVPIHEDYLPELLNRARANGLGFTSDLRAATQSAQADAERHAPDQRNQRNRARCDRDDPLGVCDRCRHRHKVAADARPDEKRR